jgi:ribosome biogenesis GTPase
LQTPSSSSRRGDLRPASSADTLSIDLSAGPRSATASGGPDLTGFAELTALGWDAHFATAFTPFQTEGLIPARLVAGHSTTFRLATATGELEARLTGRLRATAGDPASRPVVGDWVACAPNPGEPRALISAILPRRTSFSRRAPGLAVAPQVLAANVDTALLVCGLDHDFNPRRIERYLVITWESGARPVLVLTKTDQCADVAAQVEVATAIAPGVPVHAVCAVRGEGLAELSSELAPNRTFLLLGSSGAGKSTLLNWLAGRDLQRTGTVRARDSRGQHTTTHRELFALPGGALVIDSPGLREIQLWSADQGHGRTFDDVEQLSADCRFADCSHQQEPSCAVREAIETGSLAVDRFESYLKLQRELRHLHRQLDQRAQLDQKRQVRTIHRQMRDFRPRQ